MQTALPMLRVLDFSGYEARVVGADVLCALEHVLGTNLRFSLCLLDLGGCPLLDGTDIAEIKPERAKAVSMPTPSAKACSSA